MLNVNNSWKPRIQFVEIGTGWHLVLTVNQRKQGSILWVSTTTIQQEESWLTTCLS